MKRSTTVGTCQMITTTTGAQRKLLAEFNRNESEGSTSPERDHRQTDIHGFADSRLALVRRSMIARRTQARLREKRRRNRTVALSPEDDRRSSFISTFLADTKQLQDQSCQVPSENSTLSKGNENGDTCECPDVKNVLPKEFDLIAKQMELQDTSSGCWSGGSTIQGRGGGFDASTPTPKLLLQELNDHNLMRHNQITAPSSQASSRECEDEQPVVVKSKPDPPRRSLSSRPSTLEYDIDPRQMEQNGVMPQHAFDCFAPIVLTPSNPSEGDFTEKNAFVFPSPPKAPKPTNSVSSHGDSESLINSPARSSRSDSSSQINEELSAKLARRLTKIELIESGQSKAFDKEDLDSSFGSEAKVVLVEEEKFTLKPINFDSSMKQQETQQQQQQQETVENGVDDDVFKLPSVSSSKLTNKLSESSEMPSVEVIWDNDLSMTNPIPEPITPIKTPTSMMLNSDSESQCSDPPKSAIESPLSSPCRYQVRPMVIQPSLQATQSLMERGRTPERRHTTTSTGNTTNGTQRSRLGKTNSANFKSLLLRSIGSNDKTARSSAAERLKVAPGKTLQDLYRPGNGAGNAQSPVRKPEDNSPRKVRNKSKGRYNTLHRLTSIVEEKDILAAKELIKSET